MECVYSVEKRRIYEEEDYLLIYLFIWSDKIYDRIFEKQFQLQDE